MHTLRLLLARCACCSCPTRCRLLPTAPLSGLVEAWAGGVSWADVMADTSLDDGDMARLLARTADMLKQVRPAAACVAAAAAAAAVAACLRPDPAHRMLLLLLLLLAILLTLCVTAVLSLFVYISLLVIR